MEKSIEFLGSQEKGAHRIWDSPSPVADFRTLSTVGLNDNKDPLA